MSGQLCISLTYKTPIKLWRENIQIPNVGNTINLSLTKITQSACCLANMCVFRISHANMCTQKRADTHSQVHLTSHNALPLSSEILPRGNLGIPWDRNWISIDPGRAKGCSRTLDYCTIQGPRCQEDIETCLPSYLKSSKVLKDSRSKNVFYCHRQCSPVQQLLQFSFISESLLDMLLDVNVYFAQQMMKIYWCFNFVLITTWVLLVACGCSAQINPTLMTLFVFLPDPGSTSCMQ